MNHACSTTGSAYLHTVTLNSYEFMKPQFPNHKLIQSYKCVCWAFLPLELLILQPANKSLFENLVLSKLRLEHKLGLGMLWTWAEWEQNCSKLLSILKPHGERSLHWGFWLMCWRKSSAMLVLLNCSFELPAAHSYTGSFQLKNFT